MPESVPVYVAAGSNVAPLENLRRALDVLDRRFAPLRLSHAYANAAVGFTGDDFVNLAVGFTTALGVQDVIAQLHEAEAACGRARTAPKWAPRSMDLDILLYGDTVVTGPALTLPRPDLLVRPYMLGPLAEIAPRLVHPVVHRTIAALWRDMQQRESHALRPVAFDWHPRISEPDR